MENLLKKMLVSVEQTREKMVGLTRRIHIQLQKPLVLVDTCSCKGESNAVDHSSYYI